LPHVIPGLVPPPHRHPRAYPPSARHPRACPGDLVTIGHSVDGGCHALSCPFLMGVLGTSPRMTEGGVSYDGSGGCHALSCPFLMGVLGTGPRMTEGGKGGPRDKPEDDGTEQGREILAACPGSAARGMRSGDAC